MNTGWQYADYILPVMFDLKQAGILHFEIIVYGIL